MYSRTIHESRKLKQARPIGQYVDLLRDNTPATPSWDYVVESNTILRPCKPLYF